MSGTSRSPSWVSATKSVSPARSRNRTQAVSPVAGGPSSAKMLAVLHHLKNLQIVGADLVEVSPPYDHADMTAVAGSAVAMYVLGILADKKAAKAG